MWRFKYLLIGMLISGLLGVVLYLVGRYVYDEFRDELQQDAVAAVDDYFVDPDTCLPPLAEERVTITEAQLTTELQGAERGSTAFDEEGLTVDLEAGSGGRPGRVRVLDAEGTNIGALAPTVAGGRVELGDPTGAARLIPFDLTEIVVDQIEVRLAEYFAENNAVPTAIEVTADEVVVEVEPVAGESLGGGTSCVGAATPRAGASTPRAGATATPRAGATATPRAGATARASVATTRPAPTSTPPAVVSTPTPRVIPSASAPSPTPTRSGIVLDPLPTRTPTP